METTVVIDKVFTQSGSSSKGPWTRYDVKTDGPKFQTFDEALGRKAQSLEKQSAKFTYHEQTRGEHTNNVIDSLEAGEGASAVSNTAGNSPQDEYRRTKEEVRRSEAVNAAATILSSPHWNDPIDLTTLATLADQIAVFLETGDAEGVFVDEGVRF